MQCPRCGKNMKIDSRGMIQPCENCMFYYSSKPVLYYDNKGDEKDEQDSFMLFSDGSRIY